MPVLSGLVKHLSWIPVLPWELKPTGGIRYRRALEVEARPNYIEPNLVDQEMVELL